MNSNSNNSNTNTDNRKYKDRGIAHPTIPKVGFTKRRRRLEDGGKTTN